MNRSLAIPAGVTLVAFVVVASMFHKAAGRDAVGGEAIPQAASVEVPAAFPPTVFPDAASLSQETEALAFGQEPLLSVPAAKEHLSTLTAQYLGPWRQWQSSPRFLYSRVAPRPVPSVSEKIDIFAGNLSEADSLVLATIEIKTGEETQAIPCVIDRHTQKAWFYNGNRWLNEAAWLAQAPLPNRRVEQ